MDGSMNGGGPWHGEGQQVRRRESRGVARREPALLVVVYSIILRHAGEALRSWDALFPRSNCDGPSGYSTPWLELAIELVTPWLATRNWRDQLRVTDGLATRNRWG